jgi:hypothetical protein
MTGSFSPSTESTPFESLYVSPFISRSCTFSIKSQLKVGFYHVCGADPYVLHGTDFHDLGHVYAGAWGRLTNALALAHKYGIGVMIGAPPPFQFMHHI